MFQNIHIHIAKSSSVSLGKKTRLRGFAKPVFTIMFLPQHRHEDGQIETEGFRGMARSKELNIYIKTKPHMSIIQIGLLKEKKPSNHIDP